MGHVISRTALFHSPLLLFWPTYLRAMAVCSSIWFLRCFSRFCSMSSWERSPRMAFLGAFFLVWAEPPPNQLRPQPDILSFGSRMREGVSTRLSCRRYGSSFQRAYRGRFVTQLTDLVKGGVKGAGGMISLVLGLVCGQWRGQPEDAKGRDGVIAAFDQRGTGVALHEDDVGEQRIKKSSSTSVVMCRKAEKLPWFLGGVDRYVGMLMEAWRAK